MAPIGPDTEHEDHSVGAPTAARIRSAMDLLEQAGEQLDAGRPVEAVATLRQAVALDPEHPRIRSRLALAMVRSGQRFDEARAICEQAVQQSCDDAGPYLDLAHLFLEVDRRAEGLRCLRRGRMIDPSDEAIDLLLDRLGQRRPAVLAFLPRRHVLNRLLGALRARLSPPVGGN